jgi:hypothetical protein
MQDLHDSTSPPASPPILIECREGDACGAVVPCRFGGWPDQALPGKLRTHRKAPYQPS